MIRHTLGIALCASMPYAPGAPYDAVPQAADAQVASHQVIEDFEDGMVELCSYPGEDVHPDSWALDSLVTHQGSSYSLRLHGNTWKLESISPRALDSGDVWQVAAYVQDLGEIQGLGLVDSRNALLYAFAGTEQLDPETWVTVYQGAFPLRTWNVYQLPVGEDWLARFGYLPQVTSMVFTNDRDTDPRASVYFDDVFEVTEDLPNQPEVEIWYETGQVTDNADGTWSVTVQFYSRVTDPDSPTHWFFWHFGDDSTSSDSNPRHTYVVQDDHEYTVLCEVVDSTGLWGRATCRVSVDPGPTSFPVTVNFVGDIMLARRYELPGGIIETLGPEGIFRPTLQYLGDAADITVANLESPLTTRGTRHPTKPIVFRGKPSNVAGLAFAGVDIVSLANNHIIDYGLEGMRETQAVLDSSGITHSGAGANAYEAYQPAFVEKSGVNIAFLALSDRNGQYDNYQPHLDAGFNKPGFAYLDTFHLRQQMRAVEGLADLVVVEMHTGEEYEPAPGGRWNDEVQMTNDESGGDESYSPFALCPAPGDTQERHRAIDAGADLVVCHHPHVLQGFEVYRGKLIAHSLGNFAFDQEYPETYPSVILKAEIDDAGFCDYTVLPVYVDDYIPVRAEGKLGRHILDYLARRSRELGTVLVVNRDSVNGRIILDTLNLLPWARRYAADLRLDLRNGYWTSEPLLLARDASISRVVSVSPSSTWQFRLGRQAVWMGSFEDEGSTLWLVDEPDEFYDTVACQGRRSLCQVRPAGSGPISTGLEERMACYSESTDYTIHGHIKTRDAQDVGITAWFYDSRTGSNPLGSANLGTLVSGTTGWNFHHREFVPAARTQYWDLSLESGASSTHDGRAWFDDVGIVGWEEWQPMAGPVPVPFPNDYYWIQIRTNIETARATLQYEETGYDLPTGVTSDALRPTPHAPRPALFASSPTSRDPVIQYQLASPARVLLKVYNGLGQEVRTVVDEDQGAGRKAVVWDRKDRFGRTTGAGAYFCRLQVSSDRMRPGSHLAVQTCKAIVIPGGKR